MTEECLGENPERYVTFSVPIQKELANGKTVTYKIKFVDSVRFILSPLSSLANNFLKDFIKINVKIASLLLSMWQLKVNFLDVIRITKT